MTRHAFPAAVEELLRNAHPALAVYAGAHLEYLWTEASGEELHAQVRRARAAGAPPEVIADLRDRSLIYLLDVEETASEREQAAYVDAWAVCPDTACDISGELHAHLRRPGQA